MEFQLLGAVAAWHDGHSVELGRRQERCLLGLLLLEAGHVVPTERLLNLLWRDVPPASGRKTIQTYVARLRSRLTPHGVRLTTRGIGYVLEVDPLSIDLHVFCAQIDAAREISDPSMRVEALSSALALWLGPPLAGVADDDLRERVGAGPEEQRLSALEGRAEAMLEIGQLGQALPELTDLVQRHPLRERPTMLLMLVLHRLGRQADALAAYRRIRQALVDEVGLEPSAELQQLHQQILQRDPRLTRSNPKPVVAGRRFLPRDPPDFVGRTADLAQLDVFAQQVAQSPGTVVISAIAGIGGVGKTALALRWAHRAAPEFSDGQLYINLRGYDLRGPMPPLDALVTFLRALDVSDDRIPHDLDAASALYRSLLADQRMLVLLDNAASADQVRPLLPASPGCLVIVTSRDRLAGLVARDGARRLTLDALSQHESMQLLSQVLGRERIAAEPQAAGRLAAACGFLPLAIRIAAANLADRPHQTVAEHVNELTNGDRLAALTIPGDPHSTMRVVFEQSYRHLSRLGQRVFRLLGLIPATDFAAPAVAALSELPINEARDALSTLADAHLVQIPAHDRYVMHDLAHAYARELAQSAESRADNQKAVQHLLDHYVNTLRHTEVLLDPARYPVTQVDSPSDPVLARLVDHNDALRWYSAEREVILALIDQAYAEGFDIHCWQMTWMTANFLERQGHWRDWAYVSELAVAAAHRVGDHDGEARCLRTLARAHTRLGNHAKAREHLREALRLYRKLGDKVGEAYVHLNINIVFDDLRQYGDALVQAEMAMALFQMDGHVLGHALALNAIGWAQAHLGDYPEALANCQRAIDIQQRHDHPAGEAETWDSVGYIHLRRGDHAAAARSYQHALRLYRAQADRYNEATTLSRLGDTAMAVGDRAGAESFWHQALDILLQLGHADADQVKRQLLTPPPWQAVTAGRPATR